MNNSKIMNSLTITVMALVVVSVFGIAWASINRDLKIEGTATVKKSAWKVRFINLSAPTDSGTAVSKTNPAPTITDTKISGVDVEFKNPGDKVTYNITVKNEGSVDAKLSTVTFKTPTCTGTGADATQNGKDEANVCKHLKYTLEYASGSEVNTGTPTLLANDPLDVGQSRVLVLTLEYENFNDASDLPVNDVNVTDLEATIVYIEK